MNALIFDYLSKKDKVLAQTVKAKLKAVSRAWSSLELTRILAENEKNFFEHIFR